MGKRLELIIDYCLTNKVGSVKGEQWFRKTHGKAYLVRESLFLFLLHVPVKFIEVILLLDVSSRIRSQPDARSQPDWLKQ
jgi:hypothetical protein